MAKGRRTQARAETSFEATLRHDGEEYPCKVVDISSGGAKIGLADPPENGATVSLRIEPFGKIMGRVVWSGKDSAGVRFTDSAGEVGEILLAMATYGAAY